MSLEGKVTDECLQLFGGYGYMAEYPIARLYGDTRIQRIYGGTTETMKDLIAWRLSASQRPCMCHFRACTYSIRFCVHCGIGSPRLTLGAHTSDNARRHQAPDLILMKYPG